MFHVSFLVKQRVVQLSVDKETEVGQCRVLITNYDVMAKFPHAGCVNC